MLNSKSVVVATLAAALSGIATVASAQSDPRYDSYLNLSPQYSEIGRSTGARYGTLSTEVDPRTDSYLYLSPQYSEIGRSTGAQSGMVSTEVDPRTDSYLYLSPQYSEIGRSAGTQDARRPVGKAPSSSTAMSR